MLGSSSANQLGIAYLGLIALPVVKSNPLIVLGGVGNLLVIDPLNSGALQEPTDLDDGRHGVCDDVCNRYTAQHVKHYMNYTS